MTIVKMKTLFIFICLINGILNVCASETNKPTKLTTTKQIADDTTKIIEATAAAASVPVASTIALTNDATKDKRETKDTKDAASVGYANHRSDNKITSVHRNSNANSDDPEDPQETVYGTNARQFLIRPQQQQQQQHQQQQQNEEEQLPPQLRNYPATIRPHNTQLLEQSQEIQHFAYLQDLNRNQHKIQNSGKSQSPQIKKSASASLRSQAPTTQVEETEQRYAVAVEQPIPLHPRHPQYRQQIPYQLALQQHQQQQQAQQQQQQNPNQAQYQIIPEEQFLKILEEELQARAYQEDQVRRHQAVQANAQRAQQQAQQQQHQSAAAAAAASQKVALQAQGLGQYRQRLEAEEDGQPEYVQYVQRPREGPKYLPLPPGGPREQPSEQELAASPQPLPQLPPQIAYYQPQISYKALPNHPLAKSSLEKEIEMLLASNKPNVAPVQIIDNSNDQSAVVNHHQRAPAPPPAPQPSVRTPKAYVPSTVAPNLIDANDQPFVPSIFRFSNYPQPTQNYPAPVSQQVIDAKKLGPVVYPPQNPQPTPSAPTPAQAAQFYYQEPAPSPLPSPRPKAYRSKYGTKFATTPTPLKSRQNEINYAAHNKFTQPLYDLQRPVPSAAPGAPTHFYPSPPDPHRSIPPTPQSTPAVTTKFNGAPSDFRQFALPGTSPSQSSIYVSQGTGIATPSRPISTAKPKTVDDLKQLHLPQPGGKPLTQAEFQALVDAGYPVTAVPVPVPVPYEQYVKDHPDYRNQPPPQPPALPVNYEHLMRFAQLQQHHQVPQYGPQRPQHPRGLVGRPSEPSVKIISSASEPQTATALGGGSVTYLRAIPENQKRRPRDESETKVLGAKDEEDVKTIDETKQEVEKTK